MKINELMRLPKDISLFTATSQKYKDMDGNENSFRYLDASPLRLCNTATELQTSTNGLYDYIFYLTHIEYKENQEN